MSKSSNRHRQGREAFIPNEGCRSSDPDFMLGWMEAKEVYEDSIAAQAEIDNSVEVYELDRVYSIDDLKVWLRKYVVPHLIEGN